MSDLPTPWFGPAEPQDPWQPHYTIKAAARKLGVSERVIRQAIEMQQIRTVPLGSRVRIPGSDIQLLYERLK